MSSTTHSVQLPREIQLFFCIVGIYICFLTWGVLQERISTVEYHLEPHFYYHHHYHHHDEKIFYHHDSFFPSYIFFDLINYFQYFLHSVTTWILTFFGITKDPEFSKLVTNPSVSSNGSHHAKFDSFIFLNLIQAIGSAFVAFLVIRIKSGHWPLSSFPSFLSNFSQRSSSSSSSPKLSKDQKKIKDIKQQTTTLDINKFPSLDRKLFLYYLRVAICYTLASPFGYTSVKYIGYVAMSLGKSCKLLPVLFMNIFIRKQKVDHLKLISVLLITIGVTGFMLCGSSGDKNKKKIIPTSSQEQVNPETILNTKTDTNESSLNGHWIINSSLITSIFGIILLLTNLMLDGAMNSWQDEMFHTYKMDSFHMMYHLNWISCFLMILYLGSPISNEWYKACQFLLYYPAFVTDIVLFSFCGALGQVVVFYTLENFGALSLVTVTVTRKLFTILLSVFLFGHQLNSLQWISVMTVFVAVGLESYMSRKSKKGKLLIVQDDKHHHLSVYCSPSSSSFPLKDPKKDHSKLLSSTSDFEILDTQSGSSLGSSKND